MIAKHSFNIDELHANNLAEFVEQLGSSRFWYVLPEGENDIQKAAGIFDTNTGLLYPSIQILNKFIGGNAFVFVKKWKDAEPLATLECKSLFLWRNEACDIPETEPVMESSYTSYCAQIANNFASLNKVSGDVSHEEGKKIVNNANWAGITGWTLPSKERLMGFAKRQGNPHRTAEKCELLNSAGKKATLWLTSTGSCDISSESFHTGGQGGLFACNPHWINLAPEDILKDLIHRNWYLVTADKQVFQPDERWGGFSVEQLQASMVREHVQLISMTQPGRILNPQALWINNLLVELDYTPCRMPKLDNAQLSDPDKGLWELWNEPPENLKHFGLIARDPGLDIQRRAVAIDFGTSSTVVAMDTANGGRELLRIGVRDFYQAVQPQHFENPTVLECLDFPAFNTAWTERAYRPLLDWNAMRAAHEAQASYRDNPGDTKILTSILPRIKQWALRSDRSRIRLTDRQGKEIELTTHMERNPVRGQPLNVSPDDLFDPVELYAWYLGMAINWRGRGLFLKYYLSFPVKYPREVKDRILASFRRGLQRSLPQTLIDYHPQVLNDFEVNDLASEPAAYAAAALPHLGIKPTDEGVPYAVFDFGGGTTDFDFGLLRWATAEEEDAGYEQVFEHLSSSGDNYLGGENLLENLVYESFLKNLDILRTERIQFTKPLDAQPFAGSEAFLVATQAAQTNTVMLAAKLRSFLEGDTAELPSQIKLDLIDVQGSRKTCELTLDVDTLDSFLSGRIQRGVEAFLAELAAIKDELPAGVAIQVLLAGNGCRSRYIKTLFDTQNEIWRELLSHAFGEMPPDIVIHPPLPRNEANPHAPTTKTGVALGLLRLSPGKNVLLKNHVHEKHDGKAPFAWFAGRLRRGKLEPTLMPGVSYGQWQDIGPLQEGVFYLYTSTSPRAHEGLVEGDPELNMHRLDFPAAPSGARLYAKAVSPNAIDLCAILNPVELDSDTATRLVLN